MTAKEATELGRQLASLIREERTAQACALLSPILAQRTPFRLLDRIGEAAGAGPLPAVQGFLKCISAGGTEGGWVVMASILRQQLASDPEDAFACCRAYIITADVWYGADIFGERVPGPALVDSFPPALKRIAPWRYDENRWVRRTVGVAAHYWAKRSRGAPELVDEARDLLAFLEPMFEEWDMDAVKGIGWGLKTLGRHYPELVADWLQEQVVHRHRRHRALMLRKALTYLPQEQRARVSGVTPAKGGAP
jgi:hypothetical protein